jgi:hypothetical protein
MSASTANIEQQIKDLWKSEQDHFTQAEQCEILAAELVEAHPDLDIDRLAKEFALQLQESV